MKLLLEVIFLNKNLRVFHVNSFLELHQDWLHGILSFLLLLFTKHFECKFPKACIIKAFRKDDFFITS